jgi:hypothetical protein
LELRVLGVGEKPDQLRKRVGGGDGSAKLEGRSENVKTAKNCQQEREEYPHG